MKQYDAIIIGFGKAGKTLAAELSNRGWQVAIVRTFQHDVWRKLSECSLYPNKDAGARIRGFQLCFTTMIFPKQSEYV